MDVHPLIRHEPDPDHPGWWTWELAGEDRFNGVIGKLLVRAGRAGAGDLPDVSGGARMPISATWSMAARS